MDQTKPKAATRSNKIYFHPYIFGLKTLKYEMILQLILQYIIFIYIYIYICMVIVAYD